MNENRSEFHGKLCLVTGAGQGIGLACAKSLLAQGAHVIACDVSEQTLMNLMSSIPDGQQVKTTLLPFDLANPESIQSACQRLEKDKLIPEYIATCAGTLHLSPVLDLPLDALNKTLDVNLKGTLLLTQSMAKLLVKSGKKGTLKSLQMFLEVKSNSTYGICISSNGSGKRDNIIYFPLYGVGFNT